MGAVFHFCIWEVPSYVNLLEMQWIYHKDIVWFPTKEKETTVSHKEIIKKKFI